MKKIKAWFSEYWKDLLKVVTVAFAVFYVAVFSGVWSDRNYESNFWPNFFEYSGYIIGVILVAGWIYLWVSNKPRRDQ